MTTKPKFKSDAFAAIHSSALALHKAGAVSKTTLREFDESCLATPGEINPKQTKKINKTQSKLL